METFVRAYDTKPKKIILPPDASFSRSVSPEQVFSDERQASFLQMCTLVFTFCLSMRVSSTVAESLGNLNQLIFVSSTYPGANVDPSAREDRPISRCSGFTFSCVDSWLGKAVQRSNTVPVRATIGKYTRIAKQGPHGDTEGADSSKV